MTALIRKIHRWTSLLFSLAVAAIFAGMPLAELPEWVYYLPLPPLAVLLPTGLYLFALPYLGKREDAAQAVSRSRA
ncbi:MULTISPECIES: hypothetical protein [unclassified Ensifer]|uniref:hypothetical protein n=1 Tax=unclassified Ensifer TaxID=2633371 RepID=UPI0008136E33|nr:MULTISPECIES: hypothetical protein [unclassified Ensifer]OCP00470.1 hypothetical protein BC362_24050 [Ensifer sp. LC14]OCP05842.1 hypothetical protein BBX50_05015 [Ensifer sp. LC11]OCP06589.1 hypothetical protein BC374_05075 [Ensifer sp. LC13]OCP31171.1 hypothetical protein BC364_05020 [Ensifer sp. LC499]